MKKNDTHKNKIIKILLAILVLFLVSLVSTAILYISGVIYFDDGIKLNYSLFETLTTTWYGCLLMIGIQVVITSLLSFIPGASMAFIILIQAMYPSPLIAFIVAFSGVLLSSLTMYLIGRYGGYTICKKMIGEEDCSKASELLNNKGNIYFPLMMMFPVFPDDALIMIAGTLKMSLKWFIPSIFVGRGIGVATIVFGFSIISFDKFTSIWHWIAFIAIAAILIALVFYVANKFSNYLNKRKNKGE